MISERLVKDSVLVAPQAMTNSATVTANLDTIGAGYATIRVNLASEINTNAVGPTLSLLESDTTVATSFATVVADQATVDITSAAVVHYGVDLRGRKRYLRLSVSTDTTTNDDVTVAASATLSRLADGPNGTTSVGDVAVFV